MSPKPRDPQLEARVAALESAMAELGVSDQMQNARLAALEANDVVRDGRLSALEQSTTDSQPATMQYDVPVDVM